MGNALEKSRGCSFLSQVEFKEPFASADRSLFSGNIDDAWDDYVRVYEENLSPKADNLVNLMIGLWRECYSRLKTLNDDVEDYNTPSDVFSCRKCLGLLYEPCTLSCGHTFCRKCIGKAETFVICFTCKEPSQLEQWPVKINVALASIITKWFPKETTAAKLRLQGNLHFSKKAYNLAIEKYTKGLQQHPDDHLLLGNRSNVFLLIGKTEEALADADRACQLRPRWAKAHYRRATTLMTMKRYDDASAEFLKCILIDSSNITVRKFLQEALHKLLLNHALKKKEQGLKTKIAKASDHEQVLVSGLQNADVQDFHDTSKKVTMDVDVECDSAASSSACTQDNGSSVDHITSCHSIPFADEEEKCNKVNPLLTIIESFTNCSLDSFRTDAEKVSTVDLKNIIGDPKLKEALDDLECPLCCRILYEATTTPCGHIFCGSCLSRCLDHSPSCPICRFSLFEFIALRKMETTVLVEEILSLFFKDEVIERKQKMEEEMENLARVATDTTEDIPVFICTLALPTLPCPLHIFEPRYRLMLRQCIESGSQQFGMAMYDEEKGFTDYGCMVEIKAVKYLPDGRALVDTVGGRRFKVLSKGTRDGYRTAKVEWIHDQLCTEEEREAYRNLNHETYGAAKRWFQSLSSYVQGRITSSFGAFPECGDNPEDNVSGPHWTWWLLQLIVDSPAVQLSFLASTSPAQRLVNIRHRLNFIQAS